MADRHTIVVRVKSGEVDEVLFCECCPGLTLEVRTYTDDAKAAAVAEPSWDVGGPSQSASGFWRDERGVYCSAYFEPEDSEE